MPWSTARKREIGPVISGRPISMPTTAGPQRRMASVASATATGTAKILKSQSMGDQRRGTRAAGLTQVAAEALDALAGFLELIGGCGVGDPEERRHGERRPVHHRHAFLIQQRRDE